MDGHRDNLLIKTKDSNIFIPYFLLQRRGPMKNSTRYKRTIGFIVFSSLPLSNSSSAPRLVLTKLTDKRKLFQ